jgi:hypothetical protein
MKKPASPKPRAAEAWDRLLPPQPGSMRARMLADEELSEEEFEHQAHRIALESHEDRLKLWEDRPHFERQKDGALLVEVKP